MEGMKIPGLAGLYGNFDERWNPTYTYHWGQLEQSWRKHWDLNKSILIEKSPPLIIRVKEMMRAFPVARFIILVRDPYAHIESLMRRRNWTVAQASGFSMMCLNAQYENIRLLNGRSLLIRYEDLTDNPEDVKMQILEHLPELVDINVDKLFNAHNFADKALAITNLNQQKIALFNDEQRNELKDLLTPHVELMEFFGYCILS